MRIVLISMPDVAPVIFHESAIHMPNLGIASVGANIDGDHDVYVIDLIRKRRNVGKYLEKTLGKIRPHIVGLSAMSWQYDTSTRIVKLTKRLLPDARIVLGGYHATLMCDEIANSDESGYVDFIIRGEGEETFNLLVNAVGNNGNFGDIPSLSYRSGAGFIHNEKGENIDLARLRLPIRDQRRLTGGYHVMHSKIEVMETSRGCTRSCDFCSVRQMYGRSFRTFAIERVLTDLEDIYYRNKTRMVFVADDNLVLDPDRVVTLCEAIIKRGFKNLNMTVQADCISMARNEKMVRMMSLAGFRTVFLGIENVSERNLVVAGKGKIVEHSKKAVENCHKYGIGVIGGLIFGFPDDDETAIIQNYEFLNTLQVDGAYCQILQPYPKTKLREHLLKEGFVTNSDDYKLYNGMWANVRTKHLSSAELQYLFWYHRQQVLGWWAPSEQVQSQGMFWTKIWTHLFRPAFQWHVARVLRKYGWQGRHERVINRLAAINTFPDLEEGAG